jgi:dTDP-4-amino-4,6-dideoxygalactose transaminase
VGLPILPIFVSPQLSGSLEDLKRTEPKARQVYRRYLDELDDADAKELAIHRRVNRQNYSWVTIRLPTAQKRSLHTLEDRRRVDFDCTPLGSLASSRVFGVAS